MNQTLPASLQLNLNFDPLKLRTDLDLCLLENWGNHYNEKDYDGSWQSIALVSASGNEHDILAIPNAEFKETPLLKKCPYFSEILNRFHFQKETVRLLNLAPGSRVHTHRDLGLAYPYGCFRLHIPILTADGVEFIVDGQQLTMESGSCWYADFDRPHSVYNPTPNQRIHLVIDGLRNDWTDQLFAEAGYDLNDSPLPVYDAETQQRIEEELQRMKAKLEANHPDGNA